MESLPAKLPKLNSPDRGPGGGPGPEIHLSHSLNSLKGGYIGYYKLLKGGYIGYYKLLKGGLYRG